MWVLFFTLVFSNGTMETYPVNDAENEILTFTNELACHKKSGQIVPQFLHKYSVNVYNVIPECVRLDPRGTDELQ